MYVCKTCVPSAQGVQRCLFDPLELELQAFVNWILYKSCNYWAISVSPVQALFKYGAIAPRLSYRSPGWAILALASLTGALVQLHLFCLLSETIQNMHCPRPKLLTSLSSSQDQTLPLHPEISWTLAARIELVRSCAGFLFELVILKGIGAKIAGIDRISLIIRPNWHLKCMRISVADVWFVYIGPRECLYMF